MPLLRAARAPVVEQQEVDREDCSNNWDRYFDNAHIARCCTRPGKGRGRAHLAEGCDDFPRRSGTLHS